MFVRTASERDLAAVRALLVETWHATYDAIYGAQRVTEITDDWHSIASLQARLMRPNSEFLLADDGSRIGGMAFASATTDPKIVLLHQLYVHPDCQRQGIGRLLLDEVELSFPQARTIRVEVEEANASAIAFYEASGFQPAGKTADCGGGSGMPALVLEKRLG
ncbi:MULTISPECIES: GNAT family N-acetyltransferase [unclassified Mesorhizobium]|uniref:GNAT family N-acetyltransferase n=1 Tax=unclassified Mesorhizobium TaxID=325217 RepID=UPI000BAEABCD|nr:MULTISPECIES: GNAT family N-acetyltransferase [unclassified Mesorhizobium]TGT60104.1 GNAT family N-acetyltransferase [Mesorhizobium sp. M00.F.Ca.ET.170.01.1.1]AZO08265.1 GNAT family N-acetyltransferase [Mesorhizobium sp. M3A.F.Ca.ET.080.04.2.1]PBB85640.1 GNAT family N-acetyltransferase [Mesorhizobium sp. WSM3876]RWB71022.1 MAG: GNAT family N-acetyltransferase [Mesorhizobium sp.]RWB89283.1 MAG: GNAT family N-acetyltransferase [Mesorhizobium sp.]